MSGRPYQPFYKPYGMTDEEYENEKRIAAEKLAEWEQEQNESTVMLTDKNYKLLVVGKIYSIPRSTDKFELIKEFGAIEECFRRTSDNSLHLGREFLGYDEGEYFVDVFEAT